MSAGCPTCRALLAQAREEAEGPLSLRPVALAAQREAFAPSPSIREVLVAVVAATGAFVLAAAVTLRALR